MSLVFINHPLESFTPTASGALATIIWECCRAAKCEGASPTVITRTSDAAIPLFPWPNTVLLEYPNIPRNPLALRALRAQRKLTGWNHLRHKAYAVRVAKMVEVIASPDDTLVLFNDPEMIIYLSRLFPKRRVVHWFENQQEARPRVKRDYKTASVVTCGVSDFTSRWISDYYGIPKVPTIYNGVDAMQFCPAAEPPGSKPFINFVGRTGIEKAPDLLLKAALQLAQETQDFGVQLVGSNHWDRFEMDDYQRGLSGLVDQLTRQGIEVRRPGHVGRADLPAAFHRAHIHVVPSRWDEPFGLTTVEGMASGLATVASNTGGTPEVVGNAGLLFERNSVDDLTNCLAKLVKDNDLRAGYAIKAREQALHFPWQRTWSTLKHHAGIH